MKYIKNILGVMTAASLLTVSLPAHIMASEPEPALLDVTQFTILDENLVHLGSDHLRDVSYLFNDQDKVPASSEDTSVDSELWEATDHSNWKPNEQSEYGDNSFYIDFGANYVITGFCFMDSNGITDWTVESGEPFAWNEIHSFTTDAYNTWRGVTLDNPQTTRYLRFSTGSGDTGVAELALYGYKASDLTEEQIAKTAPKPNTSPQTNLSAGGVVGFNAFIDDPMTAIMAAGNVREYHNFSWLLDSEGKVRFDQGTWGFMDSFYTSMKEQNISIIPCFQGGSSVVYGNDTYPEIPAAEGADTLDPASYTVHAQAMYQVAARYGSNKDVDLETIDIAEGQEVKVGLGLLNVLENSNEPNKSWSGKANYFTPYELAAMCSADYDGHEGTIPNAGVKNADPDFKLAMGGLVGTESMLTYLTEMKLWFDYNRTDGKFAVDIINVHIGPDDYNPESSGFSDKIAMLQAWIDENAPGTELWISEFEVPMSDCEVEGTDNHDNENYQLQYARRVARTYLTAIGAGVDRVTKFQLRDEGEGVYYNSGLVTQKGSWKKKLAWYYVSCMSDVLEYADFTADRSDENVSIYEFTDRQTGEIITCIWSPTNENRIVEDYQLSVGDSTYAYLTEPSEYAEGTTTELAVENGTVTIDVTETPVFIRASSSEKQIINGKGQYLTPENICLSEDGSTEICDLTAAPEDSTLNQFYRMFDEPDTMPAIIYGDTDGLTAPSTNVTSSNITCYVNFEQPVCLTGFGVYDTYGTGNISVYDAYTDTLLWSSDLGGYMYRSMTLTADSEPTDKLKIVKGGGDLNELAFYGYIAPEETAEFNLDVSGDSIIDIFDLIIAKKQFCDGSFVGTSADVVRLHRYLLRME